jgi:hypothetical protein
MLQRGYHIIPAIVDAMKRHKGNAEVCENTCFALMRIARRVPNGACEALDSGALPAILAILEQWETHDIVRKNAMDALVSLTLAASGAFAGYRKSMDALVLALACADPKIKNLVITNLLLMV